uniref:Uncharacterized protein n=1 Tax=Romanomermis culicivorax TaxID=13658 RepID=A0A915KHZ3_ROMCU
MVIPEHKTIKNFNFSVENEGKFSIIPSSIKILQFSSSIRSILRIADDISPEKEKLQSFHLVCKLLNWTAKGSPFFRAKSSIKAPPLNDRYSENACCDLTISDRISPRPFKTATPVSSQLVSIPRIIGFTAAAADVA